VTSLSAPNKRPPRCGPAASSARCGNSRKGNHTQHDSPDGEYDRSGRSGRVRVREARSGYGGATNDARFAAFP
jgi:hypothetical protein